MQATVNGARLARLFDGDNLRLGDYFLLLLCVDLANDDEAYYNAPPASVMGRFDPATYILPSLVVGLAPIS